MTHVPVRAAISSLQRMVDTDAVMAAWDIALRIPEWTGSPVWIHGDFAPGNVLLVDGRLSAVIGFSGVGVGDPSDGLCIAWNLLPANTRVVFRAALKVDDATWAWDRVQILAQALVQLP
jgi:aminoglycoside phosphotransferase (APT) family kinase protein